MNTDSGSEIQNVNIVVGSILAKSEKRRMARFPDYSTSLIQAKIRQLQSQLIKPLTKENVFYHYLPLFGVKSYMEVSVCIFNPALSENVYQRYD